MFQTTFKFLSSTFLNHTNDFKTSLKKFSQFTWTKYSLNSSDPFGFLERKSRNFHISYPDQRYEDRKSFLRSMPKLDEGTFGEKITDIDTWLKPQDDIFPDEDLPTKLFNGIPFNQIPVINIKSSKNNTLFLLADYKGKTLLKRTVGMEGFKNSKKGTNVAAQQTAITFGKLALDSGIKTIRIKIKGIGPGRMSSIKGIQMTGLDIISITDNTPVSWNPPRPRKRRKL